MIGVVVINFDAKSKKFAKSLFKLFEILSDLNDMSLK